MAKLCQVQDVYHELCRLAPLSLAEDWDNVGLQVGSLKSPVHGILVSLDITEAVLWEAVAAKANLIVTHHPLFFQALHALTDSEITSRLARLAVQMDLNILSFHTNLDSSQNGLNDLLAKNLGLKKLRPLIPAADKKYRHAGLGRVGSLQKTSLKNFLSSIAVKLSLNNFRYVGALQSSIQKVAVMTGSGGNYFKEAYQAGANVLVTGDVKYHNALDALALPIALVDIGHFSGEIGMTELIARSLKNWAQRKKNFLKITPTQAQSDPFQFYP